MFIIPVVIYVNIAFLCIIDNIGDYDIYFELNFIEIENIYVLHGIG